MTYTLQTKHPTHWRVFTIRGRRYRVDPETVHVDAGRLLTGCARIEYFHEAIEAWRECRNYATRWTVCERVALDRSTL